MSFCFAFLGLKPGARWLVLVAQLALRGGGAGDAERDVPGGARHRQRPLLGALRLRQVRPARIPRLRGTYCFSPPSSTWRLPYCLLCLQLRLFGS
jgi:hypothetical protein